MRRGFFTYPWDLIKNPEKIIEEMKDQHHCNAIMLNANYHHARLLRPRAENQKTHQLAGAVAAFLPNPEHYVETNLQPIADQELVSTGVLAKTKRACADNQIDFGVWIVGLHNSSLGEQRPDLCVQNCFGDIYRYALCPSQTESQQYLSGLVADVCVQFEPDRIAVEAIGVLGLRHWVHHELFLSQWDEVLEMLFSVCFCPACAGRGTQAGINVPALQQRVADNIDWLLNEERGALPLEFTHGEVAATLMKLPDLWSYLQLGTQAVTVLVEKLKLSAQAFPTKLEVIPSSFHRPVSRAWLERVSLQDVGAQCDGLLVSSYFTSAAEVLADLYWAKQIAPNSPLIAGINACSPTPDSAGLTAQALACKSAGCEGVYYYNYGLLNANRMDWVSAANVALKNS